MSYDLNSQVDDSYSIKAPREDISNYISQLPDIEPNGPCGFILKRGESVYMEIDLTLVNEEGDTIEDYQNLSPEINCINFHIPYAFADSLEPYFQVALQISDRVGWILYDLQTDRQIKELKAKKPWWKFW